MSLADHLPALRRLPTDELRRRLTATFLAPRTTQTRQLTEALGRVLAERAVAS